MISNIQTTEWFTSPIWKTYLDINSDEIISYVYDLKSRNAGRNKSNREGWQCEDLEDAPPAHSKLIQKIDQCLIEVHKYMGLKLNMPSMVCQSWYNVNGPKSYNLKHLHCRSLFSGVFYLKVPDGEVGDIMFYRDNLFLSYLPDDLVRDWNQMTSGVAKYPPEKNMLLIFPSWLEHSVTPNYTLEDRISLSFNTNTKYNSNN
jgi:uncharacterized protein (TIGR02466 family)